MHNSWTQTCQYQKVRRINEYFQFYNDMKLWQNVYKWISAVCKLKIIENKIFIILNIETKYNNIVVFILTVLSQSFYTSFF